MLNINRSPDSAEGGTPTNLEELIDAPVGPIAAKDAFEDPNEGNPAYLEAEAKRISGQQNADKLSQDLLKPATPPVVTERTTPAGQPGASGAPQAAQTGPAAVTPPPVAQTGAPAAQTGPTVPALKDDEVRIGNKIYKAADVQRLLDEKTAPQPAAAPQTPKAPPTEAEVTAQKKAVQEAESKFVTDLSKNIQFTASKEELEAVLGGGEEGIKALGAMQARLAAQAVLEARRSIYQDLDGVLGPKFAQLEQLTQAQAQLDESAVQHAFSQTYPEYGSNPQHISLAKQVGEALASQYPDQVAKMTPRQFLAEVERQSNDILQAQYKTWNPAATGSWKDAAKAVLAKVNAPSAPVVLPAAQTGASPAVAAGTGAPTPPPVKPPISNSPGSAPSGKPEVGWDKKVASDLAD